MATSDSHYKIQVYYLAVTMSFYRFFKQYSEQTTKPGSDIANVSLASLTLTV